MSKFKIYVALDQPVTVECDNICVSGESGVLECRNAIGKMVAAFFQFAYVVKIDEQEGKEE